MKAKHTMGPFRFVQADTWPYTLAIYAGDHALIAAPLPAHSSRDRSLAEAIACHHFPADEREHAAGMNEQMIANFRLWAAAPDLKSAALSAVDQLQPLYDAMKGGAAREVIGDVLREMRAAIALAEQSN
jgi:hypothetical protein